MQLTDYMNRNNILFLDCDEKSLIIEKMITKAHDLGYVEDTESFKTSVLERESIVSTGIGQGIAIPHSKRSEIKDFFIILGIPPQKVEWDSIDNQPVSAVFLIGGPDNQQTLYLQILSKLSLFIKNKERREQLFNNKDLDTLLSLFQG